jgi:hypothetical protein
MRFLLLILIIICFDFDLFSQNAIIQFDHSSLKSITSKKTIISIRNTYKFSYRVIHYSPVISCYFKQNNIYLGPEFTRIITNPPYGDPIDTYLSTSSWGYNLGYRYMFDSLQHRVSLFFQCDFSICRFKYSIFQLGPAVNPTGYRTFFENSLSVGSFINLTHNVPVFCGAGISAFGGVFFTSDVITGYLYIGIEYKYR